MRTQQLQFHSILYRWKKWTCLFDYGAKDSVCENKLDNKIPK